MRQIADNIRRGRKLAGHTQESLARELDMGVRSIQAWELGETAPNRRNLERLARALERDPGWFYTNHDDEPTPIAA